MSHITHDELNRKLSDATKQIRVGAIYRHYKFPTREYKVLNLAIQESTESVCVIYQDIQEPNAPPFVRDLDSWLSTVEWEGSVAPHFSPV